MLCYTIEEILAEKTRALFERNGRARDVYDVVNIRRNFRVEINPSLTKQIAEKKYETELVQRGVKNYKKLAVVFNGKDVTVKKG